MKKNIIVNTIGFGSCANDVNFVMMRQALSHFLKHAGIIDGFQNRSEDYSSFFYFLHAELTLRYGIETTH